MARLSGIVVPGVPHHVTQRGNRRMVLFSGPEDSRCIAIFSPSGCAITASPAGPGA